MLAFWITIYRGCFWAAMARLFHVLLDCFTLIKSDISVGLGLFSISYLESSTLASHLASSSIPSNFYLCFLIWLHKSLGPKSLGLFWNAPYCLPSHALLTSPCSSVNTIVTSCVNTMQHHLMQHPSNTRCLRCCRSLRHQAPNLSMKRIPTALCRYVVKLTT